MRTYNRRGYFQERGKRTCISVGFGSPDQEEAKGNGQDPVRADDVKSHRGLLGDIID